ncbi:hypothetical protein HRG_014439 [Hirsutella rhossiliensis]
MACNTEEFQLGDTHPERQRLCSHRHRWKLRTAPWKRYGHCKQASIIAAKALTDRYSSSGITAYSVHPGIIQSNLQSHDTSVIGALSRMAMRIAPTSSAVDGARTSLYCATSPKAIEHAGFFENWPKKQLKDHGFAMQDLDKD